MTIPHSTDPEDLYGPDQTAAGQQNDGRFLWLATGDLPNRENPYAPGWAWLGSTSPQSGNGDEQRRQAPGLLSPHRRRLRALARHLRDDHGGLHQPV